MNVNNTKAQRLICIAEDQVRITTRRGFLKGAAAGGLIAAASSGGIRIRAAEQKKSDVRIERITYRFEEHRFRTPLKFARAVVDRQTMLIVNCTVHTATGKVASGFG